MLSATLVKPTQTSKSHSHGSSGESSAFQNGAGVRTGFQVSDVCGLLHQWEFQNPMQWPESCPSMLRCFCPTPSLSQAGQHRQSQQLSSQDQHRNHQPAFERLRFEAWRNSPGCLKASSEALLKVQNSILHTKDDLSTTLRVCMLLCVLSRLQILMERLVDVKHCTSSGETHIHGRSRQRTSKWQINKITQADRLWQWGP